MTSKGSLSCRSVKPLQTVTMSVLKNQKLKRNYYLGPMCICVDVSLI